MITIEPMGSHLHVLFGIRPTPKVVVEYGAGMQSTRAFLDRDHFPELISLVSYETDEVYYKHLLEDLRPDPRWNMSLVSEQNIHHFTDRAAVADLVLIDNHSGQARVEVIKAVHAAKPRGWVAIHDAENVLYHDAIHLFSTGVIYNIPGAVMLSYGGFSQPSTALMRM